jgi:hypothetical protein
MPSNIVTIAEFFPSQRAQMYFYKSLLESAGIQCLLSGELAEPSIGNVQLQVALPDEQRARELLANEPPETTV